MINNNTITQEEYISLINSYNNGNSEDLLLKSKKIIEKNPNISIGYTFSGAAYLLNKDFKKSEKFLMKSASIDPKNAITFNFLGLVQKNLKKFNPAIDNYKKSFELNPDDGSPLNNISNLYREIGNFAESLEYADRALDVNQENINFKINKISALTSLKRIDEAKKYTDECLKTNLDNAVLFNNAGVINQILKDFNLARSQFLKAIELKPDYFDAYLNYIDTLILLEEPKTVIKIFGDLISKFPNMHALYSKLGDLFIKLNREDEGIIFFEKLISKIGKNALIYNQIGNLNRILNNNVLAINNYEKAINLDPKLAVAFNNLGATYYENDYYELAEKNYLNAKDLNPDDNVIYHNLGNLKNAQKDFNAANNYYSLSLEKNSFFYDSLHSLVRNKAITEEDNRIGDWVEKFNSGYLDDTAYSTLGFALGDLYEQFNKNEKSFDFYKKANDILKKNNKFDLNATSEYFNSIKSTYPIEYIKENDSFNKDIHSPIFIIGMPRSGSTLVEQIISSHSMVTGLGEISYFQEEINKYSQKKGLTFPFDVNILKKSEINEIKKNYLENIYENSTIKNRFTDKNLHNFLLVGMIKKIFPSAKIIHVSRDALDQCISIYAVRFTGYHPYSNSLEDIANYYLLYKDMMNHWTQSYKENIYEVSYENLINNSKKSIENLLKYCDLSFEDNCLKFYENKRPVKTASVYQVRQKMYSSSIGRSHKFRNYMGEVNEILKNE